MHNGIFKPIENIVIGDILMGDDNSPRKVLDLGRGQDKIYTVNSNNNFDTFTANEEHILCMYNTVTNSVEEISIKNYLNLRYTDHLYGYTKSVEFLEKPIPYDPYIVGMWIGGLKHKFTTLKNKTSIIVYLQTHLPPFCDFFVRNDKLHITGKFNEFTDKIPFSYKCNTMEIRKQLLKGILDMDGESLVDPTDLFFLKRSLQEEKFKINIQYSYYGDYYGVVLDCNNRYLLSSCIVTHNTSIVECIAKSLGREYHSISLGGETDAANLLGHNFTYVGSTCGKIINILKNSKTMDPVILIDELDKTSSKDIINTFIHLTDPSSNSKFNIDKYFSGIHFDLSKAIFVFTFNNISKIDKILLDRLQTIHIKDYNKKEKLSIILKHILPNILKTFNLVDKLVFETSFLNNIIDSTLDTGMRQIKNKLHSIVSRINLLMLTQTQEECNSIIKLKYKKYFSYYKKNNLVLHDHYSTLLENTETSSNTLNSHHHYMYS